MSGKHVGAASLAESGQIDKEGGIVRDEGDATHAQLLVISEDTVDGG